MEQEYVSTSDSDEHEVIGALDPRYWQRATAIIRSRRHQGLSVPAQAEAGLIHETRSSPLTSRFLEQVSIFDPMYQALVVHQSTIASR